MKLCKESKKIFFSLTCIFISLFTFLSINDDVWAASHSLAIEGMKCPVAEGEDVYTAYEACLAGFKDGSMSSYLLHDGDNVEAGSYVLIAVKYKYGGTSEVAGYNYKIAPDTTYWEIVKDEYGEYSEAPNANDFPCKAGRGGTCTDWWTVGLKFSNGAAIGQGADQGNNNLVLTKDMNLGYILLHLKDDVTGGTAVNIDFDETRTDMSKTIGRADYTITNLNLNVAGGAMSSDNTLKTLTVKNGSTSYPVSGFTSGSNTVKDYNVVVPNNISSIDIVATANDENVQGISISKVEGVASDRSLSVGNNNFSIIVVAQNKDTVTYNVNVKRLSNVATLNGITFTNGISISDFNSATKSYTINNVPYATKNTNITATLTDSKASIKSGDGSWTLSNHGSTINKRDIVVEAENCKTEYASVTGNSCTKETYTINLNRIAPSTNKFLTSLSVNGTSVPSFDKNTKTYTVNVPNSTTSVNVLGVVEDTGKANVTSGNGSHPVNVGNNTINVIVTAEDQTTNTYTITVHRLNNDATLKTLTATSSPNGTFSPNFSSSFPGDYTYSFDATVTNVNVSASTNDTTYATVGLIDTSSGGTVVAGTSSTANATYPATTKSVAAFVTAEDGTTKTYSLKFSRAASSNTYLSGITVTNGSTSYSLDPSFKKETKSYNVTVNSDVSSVVVTGTPDDTINGRIISGNGTHPLNFGVNDIEIRIQAENGQIGSYFVHITREESSDAKLATLTVDGTPISGFDPDTETYTLDKVAYTKTSIVIDGTFSDSNARFVSGNGTVSLNTGNNALKVVVSAQDGTRKTYTINIERAKNTDASVKSVTVHGVTATLNGEGKYEVTLDNNISTLAPSDVVIAVGTDATITKPTTTIDLLTTSVNHYSFTVIAEDTAIVHPYEILITRKKSTDVSIGTVTITLNDSSVRSCTMSGTSCKIEVPVNTTGFDLTASINSTSSISPLNGTHHDMGPSESIKDIELTVTAEDNTVTKTYTVTIERQKSDNNDLRDLTINGTTVDDFRADNTLYNISIPATTSSVTIGAEVVDTGKATIDTDLTNAFPLEFGLNTINVVVRAENDRTKTYILNITREKGIDATLKDLTVNGSTVSGFDPNEEDYTLSSVDYNTVAENIGATPNDSLATVSGTGSNIALKTGDNTIKIVVTAHDGKTTKEYRIHVNRAKNTDTGIKGITIAGVQATSVDNNNYTVTVPNNVTIADINNVIVAVNDPRVSTDPLAGYTVDATNLSTKVVNNVAITVTSESGNMATYSVAVTREKSNVATLDTLTVTGGSFSPSFKSDTFEYNVTVPVTTTGFDVNATKTDLESNINSGTGHYDMPESSKTIEVIVVSEDGNTTNKYILNIERTKSSVNTLNSITVSSGEGESKKIYDLTPTFSSEDTRYTIDVLGDIDNVDVEATLTDPRAKIEYGRGNHPLVVGENTINIRVRSESNSPLDYTIIVNRARKTDAKLTDLTIDGDTIENFDPNIEEYTITTPYPNSKTSINIGATLSDSDATITGIGNKGLDTGLNTFNIVVTAEDTRVSKTYVIKVTREKSDNNNLSLLSVNGITLSPSFAPDIIDYEITVPETKAELKPTDVNAIPDDTNAGVAKAEALQLSTTKDNYYTITVTAENGRQKVYTIKVNRPKSTDATLREVKLNGASLTPVFNPTIDTYTLNVPYGATSYEIEGIPNVKTTQVFGSGTYNVADYNTITLTTMAEAGGENTKTYTFNVVEALSNDATLANLSILGYPFKDPNSTFNSAITTYDIGNIPYGISEVLINAESTNPTATIEYFVGANKQASNRVTIPQVVGSNSITVKVTAPDGITTKSYIINYNIVLSNNAFLSELTPSIGSLAFNKTNYAYELNVSNDVETIDFDITTEDNNARITINGNTYATPKKITLTDLQVGNTTLSILVTAQDNTTTHTYDVVIKKAAPVASSDATLSNLEVNGYPFATTFDPDTEEYTIGSIPYNLEELTINAIAKVGASKIKYLVNGVSQVNNIVSLPKVNGNGEIVVQVVAEDGLSVKNYKIQYSKNASNNAFLSNITISEGSITFDKTNQNYTIDVDANVNSVDITAFTEDANATISANGTTHNSPHTISFTPLNTGANTINIVVTAEDGTTSLTYTLVFNKGTSISDKITSIDYGHTIESGYIKTVKLNATGSELKDQLDNDNEYIEIWNATETAQVGDDEKLATGMIVKLIINGVEEDRQVIVIVGDTTGDGIIDTLDSVKVVNHYIQKTLLTGAYYEAALVTDDDVVDTLDSVKIVNHYIQKALLY